MCCYFVRFYNTESFLFEIIQPTIFFEPVTKLNECTEMFEQYVNMIFDLNKDISSAYSLSTVFDSSPLYSG